MMVSQHDTSIMIKNVVSITMNTVYSPTRTTVLSVYSYIKFNQCACTHTYLKSIFTYKTTTTIANFETKMTKNEKISRFYSLKSLLDSL